MQRLVPTTLCSAYPDDFFEQLGKCWGRHCLIYMYVTCWSASLAIVFHACVIRTVCSSIHIRELHSVCMYKTACNVFKDMGIAENLALSIYHASITHVTRIMYIALFTYMIIIKLNLYRYNMQSFLVCSSKSTVNCNYFLYF